MGRKQDDVNWSGKRVSPKSSPEQWNTWQVCDCGRWEYHDRIRSEGLSRCGKCGVAFDGSVWPTPAQSIMACKGGKAATAPVPAAVSASSLLGSLDEGKLQQLTAALQQASSASGFDLLALLQPLLPSQPVEVPLETGALRHSMRQTSMAYIKVLAKRDKKAKEVERWEAAIEAGKAELQQLEVEVLEATKARGDATRSYAGATAAGQKPVGSDGGSAGGSGGPAQAAPQGPPDEYDVPDIEMGDMPEGADEADQAELADLVKQINEQKAAMVDAAKKVRAKKDELPVKKRQAYVSRCNRQCARRSSKHCQQARPRVGRSYCLCVGCWGRG
jgi:hypothetical protein